MINDSGHLRVTVTSTNVTVDYIRSFLPGGGTNEQVSYTYQILPCDQRDSDGDGINDCTDACPYDPLKTDAPGACGCGVAESTPCPTFMVVRVGDGSAALTTKATAAFLEERSLNDGSLVSTTPLPTSASGSKKPLTLAGSATAEGALKRSVDGHYVTMAGYAADATATYTNVATTASTTVNRVVARISSDHIVDTTTIISNGSGFNGATGTTGNPRAAVSVDGNAFWVAGAGTSTSGGIWYVPFGGTAPTQITGASGYAPNNVRTLGIFNGQLFGATNVASFYGVFQVGTTGPPTTHTAGTLLSGFGQTSSPSSLDFAVLDRDGNGAVDMIYVSDDRITSGNGSIQKWVYSGSSSWSRVCTFNPGTTAGIRHLLAIEYPGSAVTLLGSTTDTTNTILKVVDTGGTTACTGSFMSLGTARTNTAFRGLALSPVP